MSEPTNGGRARAFEALRASEELHRVVLGNISDAVFVTDDDGGFTFICPNADVIFGYGPDEVQAMGNMEHLLGEQLIDHTQLSAHGEIRNIERDVTSKSGARRTVLIHIKRVSIKRGTILWACRDVTERKSAEEHTRVARAELAHTSRLAVVGELVASIVHEITQPLATVSMNASAGLRLLATEEESAPVQSVRDILADIRENSLIAAEVIARLRSLVRKQPLQLERLDVNDVVRDLQRLVAGEAQIRGVTLVADLESATLSTMADRVCLRHVVLNLVMNAMDAAGLSSLERVVTLRTRRGNQAVEIAVNDTGPGIPHDAAPKLFQPFFTTKKDGVGLGLTIARSLIDAQGGQIAVAATSDRGATFRVTLPPA